MREDKQSLLNVLGVSQRLDERFKIVESRVNLNYDDHELGRLVEGLALLFVLARVQGRTALLSDQFFFAQQFGYEMPIADGLLLVGQENEVAYFFPTQAFQLRLEVGNLDSPQVKLRRLILFDRIALAICCCCRLFEGLGVA